MDDLPHIRYAIVSVLQLLIFNSQLLARQLRRPSVLHDGRAGLIERMTRLLTVTDALVRITDQLVDRQPHLPERRSARTLAGQLVHIVAYVQVLDDQVRADHLQPLRLADYADRLREEAMALMPLVDAAIGCDTPLREWRDAQASDTGDGMSAWVVVRASHDMHHWLRCD